MINDLLISSAKELGVTITPSMAEKFMQYKDMLLKKNENLNLTAITDDRDIILKHFVDSISIAPFLKENDRVIDIGTGAGLPGIPLKIVAPTQTYTLLDSLNKRVLFLREVIDALALDKISAIHTRAEDYANDNREMFDIATSRAVTNLSVLAELSLPLLKIGGKLFAYKGPKIDDELEAAKTPLEILGGQISDIKYVQLPTTDIIHSIIIIDKIKETPPKFPRKPNQIKRTLKKV